MSENTIILATDGSDLSTRALAIGRSVIDPGANLVVATVVQSEDPLNVTGTGFAGGVMTPEEFDEVNQSRMDEGARVAKDVATALGLPETSTVVLVGNPGHALCDYAAEVSARAIVIGSRGHGGVRRALLGSVSDHVVRNAPCPVVVTSDVDEPDAD
jgi:nucleotide-binding universal stress UspA family protein